MRLCNFNIVSLAVLLGFWCTIAAEVSVQSSKPVDEKPIIDNGGLDPTSHTTDPVDPTKLKVAESFQNALLPGPQIVSAVNDAALDSNDPNGSELGQSINEGAAYTKEESPSADDQEESLGSEGAVTEQAKEIETVQPGNGPEEKNVVLTDKNEEGISNTDTKIENVVVDGVKSGSVNNRVNETEEVETSPDEMNPKTDNGHVSLDEKGNGMMAGNEDWWKVDSKPLIAYTEEDKSEDKSQEKVADVGKENLDEKENGMETGNEAWFKEGGSDLDEDDDASTTSTISTTVTATSPTVTNWWIDGDDDNENKDVDDYDYDDEDTDYEDEDENIWADSKDDYKNAWEDDSDDSSYKEDEEIPIDEKDGLWKSLENEPWWKETEDDDDWDTTTESWITTTDLADGDYYNSESKWGEENVKEVDAGKNMMESPHHFDNNAGVFAGAKVADENSPLELSDRVLYRWTLLLSLCLVVGLFFIFWNRHKVERFIVSWRRPSVSGHMARRGDEEKNLLHNEYA